jgi:hypothetical protein
MEFFTQNDILYMIGGYVNIKGNAIAVPAMTGVNLNSLVYAVMGHSFMPVGSVRQTTNTALAITGGEIGLMDNTVYLAFGWDGNNYTHQVSSLTFTDNVAAKSLAITLNPACATCADGVAPTNTATSSGYFRRRDGSMSAMISPKDSSNLFMYYAGVFKNGNTYFDNPISITANAAQEDSLHMRGNVYTCQVIPAWSRSAKMSYATFLGGMTNSKYGTIASPELLSNSNSTVLPVDTNNYLSVPFSNRFTTVVMDSNKNLAHYLLPDSFPATIAPLNFPTYSSQAGKDSSFILPAGSNPFNGAESEIIWRIPAAYNYNNSGVLDLDRFFANNPQGGQVGYLYGGILSVVTNVNMNNTTNFQSRVTVASNRIFGIKIVPTSTKNSSSKK